ncbi:MAG: cardiolipin synthase [Candidatus Amulumruptor caecigallinarius]|nr:cardiolipin synthase [Candidatus Amulumruptor caecigallinarius]MCM1397646.1 cardiolipin synthase [Candidatus Amulumruptor caecigallinarius]MCM1454674.1 cardiolipin synthase [bacterium]
MLAFIITETVRSWLYWSLFAVYALTVLGIIGVILGENRNPVKSLAWIAVLILFPVGGLVLYIFFGRSIKNTHILSRRNRKRLRGLELAPEKASVPRTLSAENRRIVTLARSLTGAGYYEGNAVEVFTDASTKLDALERDLRAATRYIHLQYYIFENDRSGQRIADILMEQARRGVKVRVLYDHVGSFHVASRFFKRMKEAGVDVRPFFRVAFPTFASRINWRNHRKLVVIDGEIGYVGGMNIADRYRDGGKAFDSWRDTHLRLTGPAVASIQQSFSTDWMFTGGPLLTEPAGATTPRVSGVRCDAQLITSGPVDRWCNIELLFLRAIGNAKRRIYIQTPYFLPTDALLRALQAAAMARVDVRIMMPRRSDSVILTFASQSYVAESLAAGIKIYFYDAGMLHAKMLLVDDDFCSIGSTNFDFRSFEHNFESNLMVYSPEFNEKMARIFDADTSRSSRIRPSAWRRRPLTHRALQSIVRLLSPIL